MTFGMGPSATALTRPEGCSAEILQAPPAPTEQTGLAARSDLRLDDLGAGAVKRHVGRRAVVNDLKVGGF